MTFSKNGKHPVAGVSQRHPRTLARRRPRLPTRVEFGSLYPRLRAAGLTGLEAAVLVLWAEGSECRPLARRLARSERAVRCALCEACERLQVRSRKEAHALLLCFRSGEAWGEDGSPLVLRSCLVAAEDLTRELDAAVAGL